MSENDQSGGIDPSDPNPRDISSPPFPSRKLAPVVKVVDLILIPISNMLPRARRRLALGADSTEHPTRHHCIRGLWPAI